MNSLPNKAESSEGSGAVALVLWPEGSGAGGLNGRVLPDFGRVSQPKTGTESWTEAFRFFNTEGSVTLNPCSLCFIHSIKRGAHSFIETEHETNIYSFKALVFQCLIPFSSCTFVKHTQRTEARSCIASTQWLTAKQTKRLSEVLLVSTNIELGLGLKSKCLIWYSVYAPLQRLLCWTKSLQRLYSSHLKFIYVYFTYVHERFLNVPAPHVLTSPSDSSRRRGTAGARIGAIGRTRRKVALNVDLHRGASFIFLQLSQNKRWSSGLHFVYLPLQVL